MSVTGFGVLAYMGIFAAGFSCVIAGLAHLAIKPTEGKALWGCAAFTLLGINAITQALVWLDLERLVPFILFVDPYACFFAAPCFYFYLTLLADPDNPPGKPALLLFVPPALAALATIPPMVADPTIVGLMLELSDARVYDRIPAAFAIVHRLWSPWIAFCFGAFVVRLTVRLRSGKTERNVRWIFFAGFGLSVLCWYAIYRLAAFFRLGIGVFAIFIGILIFFVPLFFVLRNPEFLGSAGKKAARRYAAPKTGSIDVDAMILTLAEFMEREKPYLNEGMTLHSLAKKIGLSPQQLSELLNGTMNKNFRDWLNEYRIREAQRLIGENPGRQILEAAFESGFRSKSTFNAAFLRVAGETPREWKTRCVENGGAGADR